MGKNRSAFGAKKESTHGFLPKSDKTWIQKSVCNGYIVADVDGIEIKFEQMWDAINYFNS